MTDEELFKELDAKAKKLRDKNMIRELSPYEQKLAAKMTGKPAKVSKKKDEYKERLRKFYEKQGVRVKTNRTQWFD